MKFVAMKYNWTLKPSELGQLVSSMDPLQSAEASSTIRLNQT